MTLSKIFNPARVGLAFASTLLLSISASADIVQLDDVIITFSLCVGNDCVNGESFGFDTVRIKENNVRIHFDDTSASASFPSNDWAITINDTSNGGASYFAITDRTSGTVPFRVEAGAPNNALYVDDGGRIGVGTASPVVEMHIADGNSPTVRLEQDGSSGFTPQTWDIAGNETNFFVRNVTAGSQLPFKILPTSNTNALVLGEVGIGIGKAPRTTGAGKFFHFASGGGNAQDGIFQYANNKFRFIFDDAAGPPEMELTADGNLNIVGTLTTGGGTCGTGCDAVFEPGYDLPSIEQHAKLMFENKYLPNVGPTIENEPINVSDKLGRMLNELEKAHIYIAQMNAQNQELKAELASMQTLEARIKKLEAIAE